MRRFIYIATLLASIIGPGCVQTSHRNVIPNEPGEHTSRLGVSVAASSRGVPLPATVYTGAIGIPGEAEAGFSGHRAFLTKLIARSGDSAIASSTDFGVARSIAFGSRGDGFFLAQFVPVVGHQFLFQFGERGRTRSSFGGSLSYTGTLELTDPAFYSGAVSGRLFFELGQHYSNGLQFSARIDHGEGLAPTNENLDIGRGTLFLVTLSWDLTSRIFNRTTNAHRTGPDDVESRR